jgi:hypothetical protein
VVLEVEGTTIRDENHFITFVSSLPAGQRIHLKVWRDRRAIAMEAVVGDWATHLNRIRASNP